MISEAESSFGQWLMCDGMLRGTERGSSALDQTRSGGGVVRPRLKGPGSFTEDDPMRRRTPFRPAVADDLESRVVLSTTTARVPSVLVSGLQPRTRVPGRTVEQPIVTLVNKAFDSFIADYTQARGAYLSTLQTTSDQTTRDAFRNYTRYRVDRLGQEITSSFVQGASARARRAKSSRQLNLSGVVRSRVNGLEVTSTSSTGVVTLGPNFYRNGTVGRALIDTIPPVGSSAAAASLSSLAQDQAIEASRVAVLNGFNLSKISSGKSN
jgi:hypothetical protein